VAFPGPSPVALSAAPPAITPETGAVHVLVVDDEAALRRSLTRVLETRGMKVGAVEDGAQALEYIARTPPDVALVDIMMPGIGGLELLSRVKASGVVMEVILMTAFADVESAVMAMKAGAYHFLTKPFHSNDAVAHAVLKAAEHRRLVDRARRLEQVLLSKERFGEIIGDSRGMLDVYRRIEGVAPTSSTVLILGESGTGKELAARAIHQQSPRAKKPFVAVNCGAIPKELVESELFGHVRGAFTGAQTSRAGLFETADTGTILLDEVGDLPLAAQVKLLRVLQEGEIKRVGADESRTVDVRVLAATNVDLMSKIQGGQFRRDLYYRLNVIAVELASHYLQKFARSMQRDLKRLGPDAIVALREYDWPGNVRELEHAIEHAVVLAQRDVISAADLPFSRPPTALREATAMQAPGSLRGENGVESGAAAHGRGSAPAVFAELAELPYAEAKRRLVASFDETYTGELLRRASGNMSEASRLAGLDRSNFRRLLKKQKDEA
jgi:DNA-binding NtrC family response regulator